jgi:hypothetical protein
MLGGFRVPATETAQVDSGQWTADIGKPCLGLAVLHEVGSNEQRVAVALLHGLGVRLRNPAVLQEFPLVGNILDGSRGEINRASHKVIHSNDVLSGIIFLSPGTFYTGTRHPFLACVFLVTNIY